MTYETPLSEYAKPTVSDVLVPDKTKPLTVLAMAASEVIV